MLQFFPLWFFRGPGHAFVPWLYQHVVRFSFFGKLFVLFRLSFLDCQRQRREYWISLYSSSSKKLPVSPTDNDNFVYLTFYSFKFWKTCNTNKLWGSYDYRFYIFLISSMCCSEKVTQFHVEKLVKWDAGFWKTLKHDFSKISPDSFIMKQYLHELKP